MKAMEYLQGAIKQGISNSVIFRGFNHAWESNKLTITQAIELLDSDFSDVANFDIHLGQSGIDREFSNCLVVYFID